MTSFLQKFLLIAGLFFGSLLPAKAYSVLTHEAIIDALWESSIKPLLKKQYPAATEAELVVAHGYAYGGALMPDMGYFPFGSKFFTNLVHYVRSGDFVMTLLQDAHTLNDYAFAIGSLSHYNADKYGHSLGTNKAVPLVYPETRKYGKIVTYEEDPIAHTRVEFGFDVLQTARGNYASQTYHDFIGFHFADTLLQTVFRKVYGLPLEELFGSYSKAVNSLRWSVKTLFPVITRAAWASKKADIQKAQPGTTARNFRYKMSRKAYNKEFSHEGDKPGFFTRMLSGLITILPKIGPLKPLKFKVPGPEAEKLFVQSFDSVTAHYRAQLNELDNRKIDLTNYDYDTGIKTEPGEYQLADQTYQCLLINLKKEGYTTLNAPLQQTLLRFFATEKSAGAKKNNAAAQVAAALASLRQAVPVSK
ncbi:MAG: hypothetical protein JWP88_1306 [Flaviaesturariibacter sp.]|nr:hypothetical protein [Flaviaesturariibacter sp.]